MNAVVDRILEVMDEYQMKIGDLEREILISPGMDAVRSRPSFPTLVAALSLTIPLSSGIS